MNIFFIERQLHSMKRKYRCSSAQKDSKHTKDDIQANEGKAGSKKQFLSSIENRKSNGAEGVSNKGIRNKNKKARSENQQERSWEKCRQQTF
jgi:hypothetical protein